VAVALLDGGTLAAPEEAGPSDFVEQYCLTCHRGKRAKANLDLTNATRAQWFKVRRQLMSGLMPPPDAEQPDAAETSAALKRLDQKLKATAPARPAAVTIRRLNRVEYQNTIRDLLGVDFDAAARFPADEVGHGFDNIGEVASLPPLLLEKYLAAAEEIARKAILDPDPQNPPATRVPGNRLQREGHGNVFGRGNLLWTNGEFFFHFDFPRDGKYILRASAFGQQAGREVVRMELRLDKRRVQAFSVRETGAAPGTFEARTRVSRGRRRVGMAFTNDFYDPANKADRNAGIVWLEVVGPIDAPVPSPAQRWLVPVPPPKSGWREHLRVAVDKLAARAFRRPAREREVASILRAVDRAAGRHASYEARLRIALTAVLVSPHFLFRIEPGAEARPLDDFELASRLSYFLWSSMPDAELFRVARQGKLRDPQVRTAQVRRMLRDARASALAQNFATQWLKIRDLPSRVTPDARRFPHVDRKLVEAMLAETVMFFDAILREERPVHELLDAPFSFVNGPLAKHYGLPGVRGDRMRRVPRAGGVLTHASILTVTSNPTRTSPVKRGKWILTALLDAPPPAPPPGLDPLKDDGKVVDGVSLRRRFEMHREDPRCAVCHVHMDALGFALQNLDAVGRWRERDEGGLPIDSSGTLPDGKRIEGLNDLKRVLKNDPAFLRSLARHLLTYALGRGLVDDDEFAVEDLVAALERTPTLQRLIRAIVTLEQFTHR